VNAPSNEVVVVVSVGSVVVGGATVVVGVVTVVDPGDAEVVVADVSSAEEQEATASARHTATRTVGCLT